MKLSISYALSGGTVFASPFLLLALICTVYIYIFYNYIFQHITHVIVTIIAAAL